MTTEVKRGAIRMLINYSRLAIMLSIGLIYVPILLAWLGEEAFGLFALLGASVGIAAITYEVSNKAMLRELAASHHCADPGWFMQVYNSAFLVSSGAMVVNILAFTALYLALPLLEIPPDLQAAARWLVAAEAAVASARILFQPAINMYVVEERFFFSNFWKVLQRLAFLMSVVVLYYVVGIADPSAALTAFAVVNGSAQIGIVLVAAAVAVALNRRLVPRPRYISRKAVRDVLGNFGLQSTVTIAMSIHERVSQVIVNLVFGVLGNTVYGIGVRLSSYVRMATLGATYGLEAVSTRIASGEKSRHAVRELMRHTTRLHTIVAVPAGLLVFILAQPLLALWVGRHLDDPARTIPLGTVVVQILMFALMSRSISDGWIAVMYGAGHLRRYAPLMMAAGVGNPLIAGALLLLLPDPMRFHAPALAFAIVLIVGHLFMLPAIAARSFGMTYVEVVQPMVRPTVVALACSGILVAAQVTVTRWSLLDLLGTIAVFGLVYALATWTFTLDAQERRRFGGAILRRIPALRVG